MEAKVSHDIPLAGLKMVSKRLLPRLFEVNEERCNLSSKSIDLNFNEACLFVSSTASKVLNFLGQSSECYEVKCHSH
jgi:hypothetical protein